MPRRLPASLPLALGIVLSAPAAAAQGPSEEAYAFFEQNCTSCHTIGGGRLAGPDLKDVEQRQSREWLKRFLLDPKAMLDSGDPYAAELLRAARGVYMPKIPGLGRELAGKLLDVVAAESALERSRFAGVQIADRPLTAADVARGRDLFLGTEPFARGAPACISCHAIEGLGGLGGGRLGPDLTGAFGRLEGKKALAAWLTAPPSPVMTPVFRARPLDGEEILALVAWLQEAARGGQEAAPSAELDFLLAGFGGAAALLVLLDFLWRGRYRDTRRSLVESSRR